VQVAMLSRQVGELATHLKKNRRTIIPPRPFEDGLEAQEAIVVFEENRACVIRKIDQKLELKK